MMNGQLGTVLANEQVQKCMSQIATCSRGLEELESEEARLIQDLLTVSHSTRTRNLPHCHKQKDTYPEYTRYCVRADSISNPEIMSFILGTNEHCLIQVREQASMASAQNRMALKIEKYCHKQSFVDHSSDQNIDHEEEVVLWKQYFQMSQSYMQNFTLDFARALKQIEK